MNHFINFLRKRNDGYVSIEVVIIGGLIIGFGGIMLGSFSESSRIPVNKSVITVEEKFDIAEKSLTKPK